MVEADGRVVAGGGGFLLPCWLVEVGLGTRALDWLRSQGGSEPQGQGSQGSQIKAYVTDELRNGHEVIAVTLCTSLCVCTCVCA